MPIYFSLKKFRYAKRTDAVAPSSCARFCSARVPTTKYLAIQDPFVKGLKTTPSVYFSKAYELVLQRPKQPGVLCQHLTALGSYAALPFCIHMGPIQSRWLSYVAYIGDGLCESQNRWGRSEGLRLTYLEKLILLMRLRKIDISYSVCILGSAVH